MTERVFLVIGAGAGIGGHAAARFSRGGYHAVLARRSDDAGLARLVDAIEEDGGKATGTLLDAAADGSIEELVDRVEREIGPIHTVLYNLGAQIGNRTLGDTPHRTFELGWRLGCFGLFRLAHAVTPLMVARGSGKIVTVGANAAVHGVAQMGAYTASKSVVLRLTEAMAAELRGKGINVNCVMPSIIDTPANRTAMPKADPAKWVAPRDIASVISFLCSNDATAIHGALVPVVGLS